MQKDASGKEIELKDLPLDKVKQLKFEFCAPEAASCLVPEVHFVNLKIDYYYALIIKFVRSPHI